MYCRDATFPDIVEVWPLDFKMSFQSDIHCPSQWEVKLKQTCTLILCKNIEQTFKLYNLEAVLFIHMQKGQFLKMTGNGKPSACVPRLIEKC